MNALQTQIGGDHYKKFAIQPIEYAHLNHFPPALVYALKYIMRFPFKGGKKDIEKALHCCELQLAGFLHPFKGYDYFKRAYPLMMWSHTPAMFCEVNKLSDFQTFVICKICQYQDTGAPALESAIGVLSAYLAGEGEYERRAAGFL